MNVLLVTWEYPPRHVGLNSSFIQGIARTLSRNHQVYVVTYDTYASIEGENPEVHRVPFGLNSNSLFNWALLMNTDLKAVCSKIIREKKIDVVHGFEWPVVPTAIAMKKLYDLPLIVTLNSTEHQRSGLHETDANLICDMEWWGCYEADTVLASQDSVHEIARNYAPPENKLKICKNANDVQKHYEVIDFENTDFDMGVPAQ